MNLVFIYLFFMKTSEKIKHLVGYRFQELFPNPKNGLGLGLHLVVVTHREFAFGVRHIYMVIGKTYDRPHGYDSCV